MTNRELLEIMSRIDEKYIITVAEVKPVKKGHRLRLYLGKNIRNTLNRIFAKNKREVISPSVKSSKYKPNI